MAFIIYRRWGKVPSEGQGLEEAMLVSGARLVDGQFKLDGYPEGSSVRGLNAELPDVRELLRLFLFRSDLTDVVRWLEAAKAQELTQDTREALCTAALVRFCCCFEGTSGLRTKPLKQKKVFAGDDRKILERLRQIRNKLVAHDEHLYPGEFPLIVLDAAATAIEAVVFGLRVPFSGMQEADELKRLAETAFGWIVAEFEVVASKVVADINALPAGTRREMRDTMTDFTINIAHPEDRFWAS